jgi:hypothetical protein
VEIDAFRAAKAPIAQSTNPSTPNLYHNHLAEHHIRKRYRTFVMIDRREKKKKENLE